MLERTKGLVWDPVCEIQPKYSQLLVCIGSFLSKQLCCPMWALAIMWSEASCVLCIVHNVAQRASTPNKPTCFYRGNISTSWDVPNNDLYWFKLKCHNQMRLGVHSLFAHSPQEEIQPQMTVPILTSSKNMFGLKASVGLCSLHQQSWIHSQVLYRPKGLTGLSSHQPKVECAHHLSS